MKTIPTTAAVAAKLEQYARTIAPAVAFIITLAVHTYWLGYRLGRMIHTVNDWLAHRWPTRPQASTTEPLADIIVATGATVLVAPVDDVLALRAAGLSQRAIAAQLGVSRATVRRRLATV